VFKFEEQEELHNNIIDKGLLKLCQANIKRAEAMASEFPDVRVTSQILIGKPFQVVLRWAAEIDPTLLVLARHGAHRIDGTEIGSQADNVLRLVPCNVLLVGTEGVSPEDIPWIEEDGEEGLEWAPEAEVRILRVPPFALGIARRAVEEYVLEHADFQPPERPIVTNAWLDEAIRKLLPTHMQLIMGIGDAEELARAEVKAEEAMRRTVVMTSDADEIGVPLPVEARCPYTGQVTLRDRTAEDPPVWTVEAFARLGQVPLIARPLARNTVERFAGRAGVWRITRRVMDENRQSMIEADEFDLDTMLVMFNELKVRQATAETAGADGLSEEMRRFIEEAKASGVTRCPIRDIEDMAGRCPVDLTLATPESAKEAVERALEDGDPSHAADEAVGRDT
ncbi:MAG: universal stress protein, partial [Gemmatimonadota bacterium]